MIREVFKLAWGRAGWPLQAAGFDVWQQLAELGTGAQTAQPLILPGNVRASRQAGSILLSRAGSLS